MNAEGIPAPPGPRRTGNLAWGFQCFENQRELLLRLRTKAPKQFAKLLCGREWRLSQKNFLPKSFLVTFFQKSNRLPPSPSPLNYNLATRKTPPDDGVFLVAARLAQVRRLTAAAEKYKESDYDKPNRAVIVKEIAKTVVHIRSSID